jgi:tetratricopeptide (TPR) repeat protein
VAYESLLATRRQALHAAATGALETIYAGRLEDACDRLAHHAARAEDAGKAVAYLSMVAGRAARNHANAEAASVLRPAREHAERLPQPERDRWVFDLLRDEGQALFYLGRRREAVDLLSQFEDRLERLGDPLRAARFYGALGLDYSFLGDRERAGVSLMRAIVAAREAGDGQSLGRCLVLAGLERLWAGRLRGGVELGRQAVALLEGVADTEFLANAHWMVGWVRLFLGEFEAARDALGRFHALGETTGDPRIQRNAGGMLGLLDATVGDPLKAIAMCRRAVERAPAPHDQALALGWLGCAHLEHGDRSEAVDVLERADRMAGEYRSLQVQALFKAYLGDAYLAAGRLDDAQALSSRSREIAGEVGYPYGAALGTRTLGRIAHAQGAAGAARALLGEAREAFAAMEMRLELARTFLDLAAVAHAEGDAAATAASLREAHALCSSLGASRDVARAEALARAVGVTLPQLPSPA